MGRSPHGKTLDRKDNEKGYHPSNCHWATRRQQARNRRSNKLFVYNGEKLCVAELAERVGLPRAVVSWRLNAGWKLVKALQDPVRRKQT